MIVYNDNTGQELPVLQSTAFETGEDTTSSKSDSVINMIKNSTILVDSVILVYDMMIDDVHDTRNYIAN